MVFYLYFLYFYYQLVLTLLNISGCSQQLLTSMHFMPRISTVYSVVYRPSVIFYETLVFPEQLNTNVYSYQLE